MFNRLGRRVTLTIPSVLIMFTVFFSFFIYTAVNRSIYESYIKTSLQSIELKYQNFQISNGYIEEISKLVSNSEVIVGSFGAPGGDLAIVPILDSVRSYDVTFNIISIYVYDYNGAGYSTGNVTDMPSYAAVGEDMELDSFLSSAQTSRWLVRNENIKERIYLAAKNRVYNPNYGMLTYVSKIFDGGKKLAGIMVVNVDIKSLYDSLGDYRGNVYVLKGETIIPQSGVSESAVPRELKNAITGSGGSSGPLIWQNNIILRNTLFSYDDSSIAAVISLSPLAAKLRFLTVLLLAVSAVFIVLIIFMSVLLSKSITKPLNGLYDKMKNPMSAAEN